MSFRHTRLSGFLLLAVATCPAAATDEIQAAKKAWVAAVTKNDAAAMDQILSSDLVYTHSTGLVEDKAAYMKSLQSGNQKYASIDHSDVVVKSFGNAAFAAARLRMTGATKGVPFDNQLRVLHVWAKQGGKWRLVAHQTTRLP
jgi:ketosteroid isomerase-like protein